VSLLLYPNLEAEMKRFDQRDIAQTTGKHVTTISDWMNGKVDSAFPVKQAIKVQRELFPELPIEYLFDEQPVQRAS
jgi:hypothetical protein